MIATIETTRLWRKIPKILSDAFLTTTTEQNRCAMACQGCGAVLFLLKKQWNYFP